MKKILLLVLMFCSLNLLAQDEKNIDLTEVEVLGEKYELESNATRIIMVMDSSRVANLSVSSIGEALNYAPGVDIRQRGANGVQSDISMRGGTFNQVLVLLNGMDMTDPQTGHYSLNLPLELGLVDEVEVLQGTLLSQFGLSAFSGAVNIKTKPLAYSDNLSHKLTIGMEGGDHGLIHPTINGKIRLKKWYANASLSYNRSDGYRHNTDYEIGNVYIQTGLDKTQSGDWQLQLGGQMKNAGANGFYSLKYPDQFDKTKTLFTQFNWKKMLDNFRLESSLYWRTQYDCFQLIRDGVERPTWYTGHNYHVTHTTGGNLKGSYMYKIGKTEVGVEVRNEYIKSNVLGDKLKNPLKVPFGVDTTFIFAKNRFNVNYFAEQMFYYDHLTASFSLSGNWNTVFGSSLCAGANIGYKFVKDGSVYANFNRSVRLPNFTDQYYKSATQMANPNIKPEKAITVEVGAKWKGKYLYASASAFYRLGQDIIDWVKLPSEEKWRSENFTKVNSAGSEVTFGYYSNKWIYNAEVSYAYIYSDKDTGELISMYALDYLKHKLTLRLDHRIWKHFGASWSFMFQSRNGNFVNQEGNVEEYKPFCLLDGRVYWDNSRVKVYVACTNMTNTRYYDLGGLYQPGAWLKGGLAVTF